MQLTGALLRIGFYVYDILSVICHGDFGLPRRDVV